MIILGLLLVLGAAGLSFAAIQANQGIFDGSAGVIELMGRSTEVTIGEVFLVGAAAGALALLGLFMTFSGFARRARRRAAVRRQLRDQQHELRDLEREKEAAAAEAGRHSAAEERAAQREDALAKR